MLDWVFRLNEKRFLGLLTVNGSLITVDWLSFLSKDAPHFTGSGDPVDDKKTCSTKKDEDET